MGNYTFDTRFDTSHVLVELEVPVGRSYCYYKRFIVPRPQNWSYANSDYLGEGQNDNGIVRPNDWQLNLTPPTNDTAIVDDDDFERFLTADYELMYESDT